MRRLVCAVFAQPDDGIQGGSLLIMDMNQFVARLFTQTRDPKMAHVGQVIEPLKAEVAEVRQDQCAWRQVTDHLAGGDFFILAYLGAIGNMPPLLAPNINKPAILPPNK